MGYGATRTAHLNAQAQQYDGSAPVQRAYGRNLKSRSGRLVIVLMISGVVKTPDDAVAIFGFGDSQNTARASEL